MNPQDWMMDAGGNCSVALPQRDLRVQAEPKARTRPVAPKPSSVDDGAVWVMRFLALALVLFVGLLLVMHA